MPRPIRASCVRPLGAAGSVFHLVARPFNQAQPTSISTQCRYRGWAPPFTDLIGRPYPGHLHHLSSQAVAYRRQNKTLTCWRAGGTASRAGRVSVDYSRRCRLQNAADLERHRGPSALPEPSVQRSARQASTRRQTLPMSTAGSRTTANIAWSAGSGTEAVRTKRPPPERHAFYGPIFKSVGVQPEHRPGGRAPQAPGSE